VCICVYVIEIAHDTVDIFYIGEGNDPVPRNARYFYEKKRGRIALILVREVDLLGIFINVMNV